MVAINYATREVTCKIVYYGPGLSGKTTNLIYIHKKVPPNTKGKLISLATEADRTLYFDFLPINIGNISGFAAKFQLYTVPGQVYYNATRKLVLRGVDGLVFVADSQPDKMDENIESLSNMVDNLEEYGYDINTMPVVIQYNKRDLPNVLPVEELEAKLNTYGWKSFEGSAVDGTGIFDTLKMIIKIVLDKAKNTQTTTTASTKAGKIVQKDPVVAEQAASTGSPPSKVAPISMTDTRPEPVSASDENAGPIREPAYREENEEKSDMPASQSVAEPVNKSNDPIEDDVIIKSASDEISGPVVPPKSVPTQSKNLTLSGGGGGARPFPGSTPGPPRERRITVSDFRGSKQNEEIPSASEPMDNNDKSENVDQVSLRSPTMAPSSRVVTKKRGFFKRLFGIK